MPGAPVTHSNQPLQTRRADACPKSVKLQSPSQCSGCGAVFKDGRWRWQDPVAAAARTRCPACLRIANHLPGGYVELRGAFLLEHRDEIGHLIHHTEGCEKSRHPLERLIAVADQADRTDVTTTGMHLARRIGEALFRAYCGELHVQYLDRDQVARVRWRR